jgi:hypothetical protein
MMSPATAVPVDATATHSGDAGHNSNAFITATSAR